MKSLIFSLVLVMMTTNAFACGGSKGEDEEKKKIQEVTTVNL